MSRRVEPDPFTHSLEIPKKVNLKSILWAKVAETCGGSERMFSSHEKEVLDDIFFSYFDGEVEERTMAYFLKKQPTI